MLADERTKRGDQGGEEGGRRKRTGMGGRKGVACSRNGRKGDGAAGGAERKRPEQEGRTSDVGARTTERKRTKGLSETRRRGREQKSRSRSAVRSRRGRRGFANAARRADRGEPAHGRREARLALAAPRAAHFLTRRPAGPRDPAARGPPGLARARRPPQFHAHNIPYRRKCRPDRGAGRRSGAGRGHRAGARGAGRRERGGAQGLLQRGGRGHWIPS